MQLIVFEMTDSAITILVKLNGLEKQILNQYGYDKYPIYLKCPDFEYFLFEELYNSKGLEIKALTQIGHSATDLYRLLQSVVQDMEIRINAHRTGDVLVPYELNSFLPNVIE